ncbi:MAG: UDP-3-O-acyl-N-acetylglucosamine deacetylase [Dongiaceae bacterium]
MDQSGLAVADRTPRQRTLKNRIHCSGISLHHGARVTMTLAPAEADSGIVFRRTDIAGGSATIAASWRNVAEMPYCTALSNEHGIQVATVEHLLAALAGAGVDNLLVEINGPELPIMDGSAWPFLFLIECAGTIEQPAPRRAIEILKRVVVGDEERSATLLPGRGLQLDFAIDYALPAIGHQEASVRLSPDVFKSALSRARTYGFLHEVDDLRAAGLARGASLDNAVVVNGAEIMNGDGLRYRDEFVRHKLVDAIGDLYLAGAPIVGRFLGWRSGHKHNHRLLRTLLADETAWRYVPVEGEEAVEPAFYRAGAHGKPERGEAERQAAVG